MTREYLLYLEFEGKDQDQVYEFFCDYCGYSNILQVNHMYDDEEGESTVYMYIKLHCSNGISPDEKMRVLKELLERKNARNIKMDCWSIHPDDCCARIE